MGMNQLIKQESGISNLHHLTSNPLPILPKLGMWFQLSWGDLIIVKLIMIMLRFVLQSFHCNIPLNMFHI